MVIRHTILTCAHVYETQILVYMLYFHAVLSGKRGETVYTNGLRWCTRGVHQMCTDNVLPGKRGKTVYTNGVHGRVTHPHDTHLAGSLSCEGDLAPRRGADQFRLIAPAGRGLGCFENSTHSTSEEPHRELITSTRSQQTRDQTLSCPALPAGVSRS